MTIGKRFEIGKENFMCLCAMCGHSSVINIEFAPTYAVEEATAQLPRVKKQLLGHGWIIEDFEGGVSFGKGVTDIADLACEATHFWVVQADSTAGHAAEINVYYLNGKALMLEQVDEETLAGWLYEDIAGAKQALLERFALDEPEKNDKRLTPDEVAELAAQKTYHMVNYSRYMLNLGRILCQSSITCVSLQGEGTFNLEIDDDKETFVSIDREGYIQTVNQLFDLEEDTV